MCLYCGIVRIGIAACLYSECELFRYFFPTNLHGFLKPSVMTACRGYVCVQYTLVYHVYMIIQVRIDMYLDISILVEHHDII